MRSTYRILLFSVFAISIACSSAKAPATPLETFQTYAKALKKKDYTTIKLLLSSATIKMHEQQAKAQGTTLDEVVKQESLIGDGQRTVEYRNEKIDGEKATIEYKTSFGTWDTLPFVREDGVWKIDKAGYAQQIMNDVMKDVNDQDKIFDEMNNANRTP